MLTRGSGERLSQVRKLRTAWRYKGISSEWVMSWSLPRNSRDNGMDSVSHRIIESTSPDISGDVTGGYVRPLQSQLGFQPDWIAPLRESH